MYLQSTQPSKEIHNMLNSPLKLQIKLQYQQLRNEHAVIKTYGTKAMITPQPAVQQRKIESSQSCDITTCP